MAVAVAVVLDFNALVVPNRPDMVGFALKLTRNKADAEDLVQDTFCRAFVAWSRFRLPPGTDNPEKVVRGWLFCLVHNVFVDKWRARHYREDRAEAYPERILEETVGVTNDPVDNSLSDEVVNALLEIDRGYRKCVVGHANGKQYSELAKEMQVPIGTIMSRLNRGRRALREKLVDYARREYGLGDREQEAVPVTLGDRGVVDATVHDGGSESAEEVEPDTCGIDGVVRGDDGLPLVLGETAADPDSTR